MKHLSINPLAERLMVQMLVLWNPPSCLLGKTLEPHFLVSGQRAVSSRAAAVATRGAEPPPV